LQEEEKQMKTTWILIAIVSMVLIGVGFWYGTFRSTRQVGVGDITVLQGNPVEGDLVTAGRNVNVQPEIKGDLAVAASNVTIGGPVQGYLLAAGSNVNINGAVGNDLWAAGANVTVNAPVADNAMLAGRTVVLQPEALVKRDASIAGNSVEVQGRVERNLKLAAAKASLASEIGGSVEAHVRSLRVMPGAVIHGDLRVWGPNTPEISSEAKVLGRVDYRRETYERRWSILSWLGRLVFMFLALFVLGAVTVAFSTLWTQRIAERITRKPGASLLTGFLGLILIPVACLVLAITVIGIPLAVVVLALYGVALLLSGVFVSYLVGSWLLHQMKRSELSPYLRIAIGALVVAFLVSLPWIGWLFQSLIMMTGLGALLLERRDSYQRMHAEAPA
jgi:hypothetical protein